MLQKIKYKYKLIISIIYVCFLLMHKVITDY